MQIDESKMETTYDALLHVKLNMNAPAKMIMELDKEFRSTMDDGLSHTEARIKRKYQLLFHPCHFVFELVKFCAVLFPADIAHHQLALGNAFNIRRRIQTKVGAYSNIGLLHSAYFTGRHFPHLQSSAVCPRLSLEWVYVRNSIYTLAYSYQNRLLELIDPNYWRDFVGKRVRITIEEID